MKTRTLHFFSILLLLPFLQAQHVHPPAKKIALIVAVGNYPEISGWNTLAAENDIRIIKGTLLGQGFRLSDIQVLKNETATREGIIEALESYYQKVNPGDHFFFHFSGHGQQIKDNNGDELDGYDEAIVPYDSPKHFEKSVYEGERLIRDEEIGFYLNQLRAKAGPDGHVLVVIDACHSGTGTRGLANTRGTNVIMADSLYIAQHQNWKMDQNSLAGEAPAGGQGLAPMITFFSAAAGQLSYEYENGKGQQYGILSYAFSKAMQLGSPSTTYRGIFDRIRAEIMSYSPRQTPQAEGDLDKLILNGQFIPPPKYFTVAEYIDRRNVTVGVGELLGLFEGSKVGFYPIGTRDFRNVQPKFIGYVDYAGPFDCNIELEKRLSKKEVLESWVYVIEPNYGPLSVQVSLHLPDGALREKILGLIDGTDAIQLTSTQPDLLIGSKKAKGDAVSLQINTLREELIMQEDITGSDPDQIARKVLGQILRYAQAEYLRDIHYQSEEQQLKLNFFHKDRWVDGDSQPTFKLGDAVKIRIVNQGKYPIFFSIIDIQPDNHLNLVIPWESRTAEEYYLEAGDSYVFEETLYASPPTGIEVFKLIGSEQPLDWSGLLTQWDKVLRGPKKETALDIGRGSVQTFLFQIIE